MYYRLSRLLNTLTQSLHSSGVDLSHASISVQIDIGNRANSALNPLTPIVQVLVFSLSVHSLTRYCLVNVSTSYLEKITH